jgi:hypothetical protein
MRASQLWATLAVLLGVCLQYGSLSPTHAQQPSQPQASCTSANNALWLGHESVETTQIYLETILAMKEKALGKTKLLNSKFKRYRPGDQLLGPTGFEPVYLA